MASLTPKKAKTLAEKLAILDKVSGAINDTAGKKIMGRIGVDPEIMDCLKIKYIPTPSKNVNEAAGGGFPRKRATILAGLPDSGKTSLALETIGENMQADPDFVAGWLESEGSLEESYLVNTFGIDPARFVYLELDRDGAGEVALDRAEAIMGTGAVDMFVINSLKALVPAEELAKSASKAVVGTQSRMNARMTRKFGVLIAENNCAFVIITHLTVDIGSSSKDPLIVSGGHAIAFMSALTFDMRRLSIQEGEPIKKDEGVKICVRVRKNHCVPDRNPYLKTEYYAVFGEGIEKILTSLDTAVEQGILRKGGAWIYWDGADGTPIYKWNGKTEYRQFMRENPEVLKELLGLVNAQVEQMTAEEVDAIKADEEVIKQMASKDVKDTKKTNKNPIQESA